MCDPPWSGKKLNSSAKGLQSDVLGQGQCPRNWDFLDVFPNMLAGLQASPARYNRRDKAAAFQGAAMGTHDWTRVASGIFHDFHHEWISEIKRALNRGLLPEDY